MVNAKKIEKAVVEKLKERVLIPKNLRDLLRLTNEQLTTQTTKAAREVSVIDEQIESKQKKLDRLYEALESGSLVLGDLAPRIKKLKAEIDDLQRRAFSVKAEVSSKRRLKPMSIEELKRHVDDLYTLLSEGTVFERRSFLGSFIKRISIDYPQVSVSYTFPLVKKPPFTTEVLSLVTNGGPYETSFTTRGHGQKSLRNIVFREIACLRWLGRHEVFEYPYTGPR
jgi:hypothetical protein